VKRQLVVTALMALGLLAPLMVSCGGNKDDVDLSDIENADGLASFESEGIVFLPVTPGGGITLSNGATFDVEPFYIAKTELTNTQYDAFVRSADGFNNPEWWRGMPSAQIPPQLALLDQRNDQPDTPRESISWYQAVAYTRWLNARLKAKNADVSAGGLRVNGVEWEVRLPTEWEWQWAAQGGAQKRAYPWGEWQGGRANTWDARVGRTMPVGSYPDGAAVCGALDMCGNVEEWCLNKWNSPYDTVVDATDESRTLRGGSFSDGQFGTASSFGHDAPPNKWRNSFTGFRVGLFAPL